MPAPLIAIVDDDESVRTATESLVRSIGYATRSYGSAQEFLASPAACAAACVISDVHMPGMDGLELQERLRARCGAPPVIFITAYPDERMRMRLAAAGAACCLPKPFEGETLIACIERALGSAARGDRP